MPPTHSETVRFNFQASRLKAKKVMCVQPKRIAISGKIHAFMFDKTGTLTKQGLDFIGIHKVQNEAFVPSTLEGSKTLQEQLGYNPTSVGTNDMLAWSLATCHAVTTLRSANGTTGELVGNQVEVKMFEGCGWELNDASAQVAVSSKATGERLVIEKRFEFDHHTMTMSVIVRDPASGTCHVFCKGAPEKIGELCSTTPASFSSVSSSHAMQGCYVIGMAHANIGNLSEVEVAQLERSVVERPRSLGCLGLLLFRNELKPDTLQAINAIKAGDVNTVMVTGDNAHCGHYIAKACNILDANTNIYLSKPKPDSDTGAFGVHWAGAHAFNLYW